MLDQEVFLKLIRRKNNLLDVLLSDVTCPQCSINIKKKIALVDGELKELIDESSGVIMRSTNRMPLRRGEVAADSGFSY